LFFFYNNINITSSNTTSSVIPLVISTPQTSFEGGEISRSQIAQKVAIAAIKYSLLKTNIGKDVVFSFDESLSFEGNSGPYLLYTVVRCKSILGKSTVDSRQSTGSDPVILSAAKGPNDSQLKSNFQFSILNFELSDLRLIRLLARYNTVVSESARLLSPHAV
jgi:arginyl-tRNA synthetase